MRKLLLSLLTSYSLLVISCSKNNGTSPVHAIDPNGSSSQSEHITLKSGIVVDKKGENYFFGGDIHLSSSQLDTLDKYGSFFSSKPNYIGPDTSIHPVYNIPMQSGSNNSVIPRAFSQYPTAYNMWAMVRFTYDANLPSWLKNEIASVLYQMQAESNVRFYNATGQPTVDPTYGFAYPYIDFYYVGNANASDSYVGRIGGMQKINLADFVQFEPNAIIHEICHALGMFHEAQRPDRDNYVVLNTSNMKPAMVSQFSKITSNYYILGNYDFGSVMGYSSVGYTSASVYDTSIPVYTKKSDGSNIYQGYDLSTLDKSWINTFYIPYIARSDTYAELDNTVYKPDGTVMTSQERLQLQAQLNNGNPNPPAGGRIPNNF